jgi:hypothetical protein
VGPIIRNTPSGRSWYRRPALDSRMHLLITEMASSCPTRLRDSTSSICSSLA